MDTEHDTDIMTKEALEFGEWLSRVAVPALLRRTRLSERRARAKTLRENMDIVYLSMELFFHPLLAIHVYIIVNAKTHFLENFTATGFNIIFNTISWTVKNFSLLVYVCVTYQEFYLAVMGVDMSSASILSNVNSAPSRVRRICKNVRRLNECASAERGLRAGGALAVDATLPLRLLALLATYTVVLLQFSFL